MEKFNEWMNEIDYEDEKAKAAEEQAAKESKLLPSVTQSTSVSEAKTPNTPKSSSTRVTLSTRARTPATVSITPVKLAPNTEMVASIL